MLETDWMQYDIWMNLKFFRYNEWVTLRRDHRYPLAQLVPVRRESYDEKWALQDKALNCNGADREKAAKVFDSWNEYKFKKWMAHEPRTLRLTTKSGKSPARIAERSLSKYTKDAAPK